MSISRTVHCDECGDSGGDWGFLTDAEARRAAHASGWITLDRQPGVRRRVDYCPRCVVSRPRERTRDGEDAR